jgi:hypothetical protein
MKRDQDAFHFHMVYGTRHSRGVEVFKETEKHVIPFMHETRAEAQARRKIEKTGQLPLLDAASRYREAKVTRYQARSLGRAGQELQRKLKSSGQLAYKEAWATAMQHSAVTQEGFRELLADWQQQGLIEILPSLSNPRSSGDRSIRWRNA